MAYFRVSYLGQLGVLSSISVEAETREQAIVNSGVARALVHSCSVDHLGGIRSALFDKKLSLVDQSLVLASMASKVGSGKTFGRAVVESVDFKKLGLTISQVESCQTPRDYLQTMRFDDTVILLAEAGDKSGRLPESLQRASKTLLERIESEKEFGKALAQGLLYVALGLAFMVGIPLWAGSTLDEFIIGQKIPLQLNSLSHVIMFLREMYTTYGVPLVGGLVAAYFFREKLWNSIRRLPVINFINERIKIKRALDFVQSYQLLLSSGFTNPQSFKFMIQRSKGDTHRLYEAAAVMLNEGRELCDVFDNDEWPLILHQNLSGFDEQTPAGRDNVLLNLSFALKTYYLQYSAKISQVASMCGFLMMILTILLFAVGFYLPIVNLNQALKQ